MMNPPIHRHIISAIMVLTSILILAGSTVGQIIVSSGSARAYGMGDAGTSLVDHRSYTVNPASLALHAPSRNIMLTVGPYLWTDNGGRDDSRTVAGAAVSFGRDRFWGSSKFCFGAAIWYSRLSSWVPYALDEFGLRFGEIELQTTAHNLALSIGFDAPTRVAFGITLKSIEDESFRTVGSPYSGDITLITGTTNAMDLGIIINAPMEINGTRHFIPKRTGYKVCPSLGITIRNIFAELDFDGGGRVEVPQEVRVSAAIELSREKNNFAFFTLLLALEAEHTQNLRHYLNIANIGGELTLIETLSVRRGSIERRSLVMAHKNWGIGFSTAGLAKYLRGAGRKKGGLSGNGFLPKLSLEVSYSKSYNSTNIDAAAIRNIDVALVIAL